MPGESGKTEINRPGELTPAHAPYTRLSQDPRDEPSYYDISFLKPPVWKWEIASYFFLGGLSSGAYILARLAERFGGDDYRDVTRKGAHIAVLTALPCAPLLIHDLGDAKRFHHMLRVFKPGSPMSLGSWTMTSYVAMAMLNSFREYARDRGMARNSFAGKAIDDILMGITDAAGIPLALLLAGYTGVLLSCTANPLWMQNPWIGPLFSASAVSTGAAAINFMMISSGGNPESPASRAMEKIDSAAHAIEAATLVGFIRRAGEQARPLTHGAMKRHMIFAGCAIIASEALKHAPASTESKKWAGLGSAALGLAAGFSLRWAMIYGGHESAKNPRAARASSRPLPANRQHKFPHAAAAIKSAQTPTNPGSFP